MARRAAVPRSVVRDTAARCELGPFMPIAASKQERPESATARRILFCQLRGAPAVPRLRCGRQQGRRRGAVILRRPFLQGPSGRGWHRRPAHTVTHHTRRQALVGTIEQRQGSHGTSPPSLILLRSQEQVRSGDPASRASNSTSPPSWTGHDCRALTTAMIRQDGLKGPESLG
jgi:hypothetical protein